jgi:hypothetical protein
MRDRFSSRTVPGQKVRSCSMQHLQGAALPPEFVRLPRPFAVCGLSDYGQLAARTAQGGVIFGLSLTKHTRHSATVVTGLGKRAALRLVFLAWMRGTQEPNHQA